MCVRNFIIAQGYPFLICNIIYQWLLSGLNSFVWNRSEYSHSCHCMIIFLVFFFRFCPPPSGLGICQRLDRRSGDSLWLVLSRFKRGAMPLLWYVDIEHRLLLLAAVTCFIYSRDLPRKTTWNILYTEWSTLLKNYLTTASKLSWTFFYCFSCPERNR